MLHNTWKLVLGSNCTEEDWQKLMQNKGEQRTDENKVILMVANDMINIFSGSLAA